MAVWMERPIEGKTKRRTSARIRIDRELWKLIRMAAVMDDVDPGTWIEQRVRPELAHLLPEEDMDGGTTDGPRHD